MSSRPPSTPPARRTVPVPQLPLSMADFARRGFRLDRAEQRAVLETHARSFLTGFNIAVTSWRDPHPELAALPDAERGFAYEGAAMHAGMRAVATAGRSRAFAALSDGPGQGYVHLVHVGFGWALAVPRVPLPVPMPGTPLLRWLAADGAGFAETFFGGVAALRRRAGRRRSAQWVIRLNGAGRALWFAESGDPDGIAGVVASAAESARPHLWAGVGLAAGYAGGVEVGELRRLPHLAGAHRDHVLQGVMFAAAARNRSGIVPAHTVLAATTLLGAEVPEVASWTDTAAVGLLSRRDAGAFLEWKARLRSVARDRVPAPEAFGVHR